jgi:hypothetical protein
MGYRVVLILHASSALPYPRTMGKESSCTTTDTMMMMLVMDGKFSRRHVCELAWCILALTHEEDLHQQNSTSGHLADLFSGVDWPPGVRGCRGLRGRNARANPCSAGWRQAWRDGVFDQTRDRTMPRITTPESGCTVQLMPHKYSREVQPAVKSLRTQSDGGRSQL